MHSRARTIACGACGGEIPLDGLPAAVACPYCHAVQTISNTQRVELARYQADVGSKLASAAHDHAQARSWERISAGRPGGVLALFGVIFTVALLLSGIAQAVIRLGGPLHSADFDVIVPVGMAITVVVSIVIYCVWHYGAKRHAHRSNAPERTLATCPRCPSRAPNSLAPGQILERCSHCGVSLLPGRTMIVHAMDAAEAMRVRAELDRYRAERARMATLLKGSAARHTPYIVLGSFIPMTLGSAMSFTVDVASSGKQKLGLAILWAIAALNVFVLLLVYRLRRARHERCRSTVAQASAPFVHRPLEFDGFVDWLSTHWAGPVALSEIFPGADFYASSLVMGDYLGLLVANPVRLSRQYPGYIALYLAAWVPAMHRGGSLNYAGTAADRAALDALGFHVTVDGAGLRAFARERAAKALLRREDSVEILTKVATALGSIAKLEAAVPSGQVPS
jgi:hypothetical protein